MATKATITTGWESGQSVATGTGTDARGIPNTVTSSSMDLRTSDGAEITVQYKNGGTAPTAACQISLMVSTDNTNWYLDQSQTATLVAYAAGPPVVGITSLRFLVDMSVQYAMLYAGGVTGTGGTITAQATALTAP